MPIYLTHETTLPGELPVRLVDGSIPFADIKLGEGSYLTVHTPAECDVLIKAATEAKRLLAAAVPDRAARVPLDVIEDEPEQQCDGEA